jgi:hypothetical protein
MPGAVSDARRGSPAMADQELCSASKLSRWRFVSILALTDIPPRQRLHVHQAASRERQTHAHKVRIRALLDQIQKRHSLVGHRRLSGLVHGLATQTSTEIDDGRLEHGASR